MSGRGIPRVGIPSGRAPVRFGEIRCYLPSAGGGIRTPGGSRRILWIAGGIRGIPAGAEALAVQLVGMIQSGRIERYLSLIVSFIHNSNVSSIQGDL